MGRVLPSLEEPTCNGDDLQCCEEQQTAPGQKVLSTQEASEYSQVTVERNARREHRL